MLEMLFVLQFIVALGFILKNFKAVYGAFREPVKKRGLLYAVYLSVVAVFIWNPMDSDRTGITNFNRIIGEGVVNGYDCIRVSTNFTVRFLLLAAFLIVLVLFFNYVRTVYCAPELEKVWKFLDQFLVLALVNIVLRGITYFYDALPASDSIFYHSFYLIDFIILIAFAYIILRLDRIVSAEWYKRFMMGGFCVSYPLSILISRNWNDGRFQMLVQAGLAVFAVIYIRFFYERSKKMIYRSENVLVVCSLFPLFTSFYIEMIHVFNQYRIFVSAPKLFYGVAILLFVLLFLGVNCFRGRNRRNAFLETAGYPVIAAGITLLSFQVPFQGVYDVNLMETANKSILISDFLNFGSIPIVEHYGGHMMTGVWEGIAYGIINHDYTGAVSSPYHSYLLGAVLALIFYVVVREIWNADMAFWTTLLFPFYNNWRQYGLGVLVFLAIIFYIKKRTFARALLIWLACVWCALYRLDLGYSFGIACVVALSVYVFYNKDKKIARQLLATFILTIVFFLVLWCILCVMKQVHPIKRLMEFIQIGLSNLNWGYNGIGDPANTVYAWHYMFLPIVVEICLFYTIFSKQFRKQTGETRWILLIILGTAYFSNFSRGLVRHSLVEMQLRLITWSAYLFLAVFISCLKGKRELFLPIFTAGILMTTLLGSDKNFARISILDTASKELTPVLNSWIEERDDSRTVWQKIRDDEEVVQRVVWNDDITYKVNSFGTVINHILREDETFVDFTNRTFVYSAIGRRNPVYVSQSPLQLSGEYVQETFNESIEEKIDRIPVAVLPSYDSEISGVEVDGIANSYRYYKVSEFIYSHYVPLCSVDEFAIWCLPDKYDWMLERLLSLSDIDLSFLSYGYDVDMEKDIVGNTVISDDARFHTYHLKKLPQIWAELDEKNAVDNEVMMELVKTEGISLIGGVENIDKSNGNYLLVTVENGENASVDAELVLGVHTENGFNQLYKYIFTVSEGVHDYIFRISSDYFWYAENINAVMFQYDKELELNDIRMKLLQGD